MPRAVDQTSRTIVADKIRKPGRTRGVQRLAAEEQNSVPVVSQDLNQSRGHQDERPNGGPD